MNSELSSDERYKENFFNNPKKSKKDQNIWNIIQNFYNEFNIFTAKFLNPVSIF